MLSDRPTIANLTVIPTVQGAECLEVCENNSRTFDSYYVAMDHRRSIFKGRPHIARFITGVEKVRHSVLVSVFKKKNANGLCDGLSQFMWSR